MDLEYCGPTYLTRIVCDDVKKNGVFAIHGNLPFSKYSNVVQLWKYNYFTKSWKLMKRISLDSLSECFAVQLDNNKLLLVFEESYWSYEMRVYLYDIVNDDLEETEMFDELFHEQKIVALTKYANFLIFAYYSQRGFTSPLKISILNIDNFELNDRIIPIDEVEGLNSGYKVIVDDNNQKLYLVGWGKVPVNNYQGVSEKRM